MVLSLTKLLFVCLITDTVCGQWREYARAPPRAPSADPRMSEQRGPGRCRARENTPRALAYCVQSLPRDLRSEPRVYKQSPVLTD